jgi:hypothetical protein
MDRGLLARAYDRSAGTSMLGDVAAGLRALAGVLVPGGLLAVTVLVGEAGEAGRLACKVGLRPLAGSVPAGRDRAFLLRRG